jgi:hypothetical protein
MVALQQKQLFDEIEILPLELKTKIVDTILNSINPITKSIDELWLQEANKRKNDIETNRVKLVNGDEVFKKISKRLNT